MKATHLVIHLTAVVASLAGSAWAIVSFVLYLVKDRPFDWASLWLTGAATVLAIANLVHAMKSGHV